MEASRSTSVMKKGHDWLGVRNDDAHKAPPMPTIDGRYHREITNEMRIVCAVSRSTDGLK